MLRHEHLFSAKVEERSATVPKFLELMPEPVENALKYYSEIQKEMLKFFEWDLFIPTAAHHIAYFMQALVTVDEKNYYNFPNLTHCMGYVMDLYQDNLLKGRSSIIKLQLQLKLQQNKKDQVPECM